MSIPETVVVAGLAAVEAGTEFQTSGLARVSAPATVNVAGVTGDVSFFQVRKTCVEVSAQGQESYWLIYNGTISIERVLH